MILKRYMVKAAVPAATLLFVVLFALPVLAHKVNVFAYVEGDTVFTESYFPDGKKVENGVIEVMTADGRMIVEGRTDTEGNFSFPLPPEKEDLNIVINATMGHKNSYLLKKSEM